MVLYNEVLVGELGIVGYLKEVEKALVYFLGNEIILGS